MKQTYEIIAVFKTAVYTGSENEFKYYQFVDAATKEQFDGYIQKPKKRLSTIRAFLPNTVISSSRYPPVSIPGRTAGLS